MDNLDDSENNAKISDSAYSNSCSNSQSRRSHSSKSTHSGSNSSGSSGYGGNPSTSGYCSNNTSTPPEKRIKVKDSIKKSKFNSPNTKLMPTDAQPQAQCVLPEPVMEFKVPKEELIDVTLRSSPTNSQAEKGVESMEICSLENTSCHGETETDNNQLVKYMDMHPNHTSSVNVSDCFSCVISMHDGIVMYTTSSITTVLGYPREMWNGRSFLDFVHERDRNVFASQITSGLALPKNANGMPQKAITQVNTSSSVVCRLRRYRGLASSFSVRDRSTTYMPFQLKLSFKKLSELNDRCIYLVVQATPFFPAYNMPFEVIAKAVPFIIRHAANGSIEFVDPESVPYLGYLPHDLIDKNALQLYHPHDLDHLQQVYETTVREGSAPRCSPYRMLVQNGDYIKLETEWSSFINPWSKKLEFVIGKHYVIEGPRNPNVFQPPNPATMFKLSEDDKAKTQCLRENIVRIMNEVLTKPAEVAKQQMTKRCQDIAELMETLIEDTPKPEDDLRLDFHDVDNSFYERDSVMLGGISPHHDYSDSKTSTDTPLSYNQLNYNDNLQRYFDSQQPHVFGETMIGDNIYGITDRIDNRQSQSPLTRLVDEQSSRQSKMCPGPPSMMNQEYIPMRLTESLLRRHNAEMEKNLARAYRETRSCTRSDRERAIVENRQKKKEHLARCNAVFQPTSAGLNAPQRQSHGLKRSSKTSDNEAGAHKHQCTIPRHLRRWQANGSTTVHTSAVVAANPVVPCMMYGQTIYGQPLMYAPFTPPYAFDVQHNFVNQSQQFANNINPFLIRRNPEESAEEIADTTERSKSKQSASNNEEKTDGESSYYSFYSSFFKTESGSAEDSDNKKSDNDCAKPNTRSRLSQNKDCYAVKTQSTCVQKRSINPPWMEQVSMTSELVYKYQVINKNLDEVLSLDKEKMKSMEQPPLVNEQLAQLYLDLQLEGVAARLTLEEGVTSSSSSDEDTAAKAKKNKYSSYRKKHEYSRLVMIYEEEAPFPPPDDGPCAPTSLLS